MSHSLFEPIDLHGEPLANRMVMAPLSRMRAERSGLATPMMATYYSQRATAGLIIAESSPISTQGSGYPFAPGIHTEAQANSWQAVTTAVHEKGGKIFLQLQHCGRISHPDYQVDGQAPVSASAIQPEGQAFTYSGPQDFVTPRALETNEIADVVQQFVQAAELAKNAGFDGIEIHAANGYIIDQFLRDGSNQRQDEFGGSIENRYRLLDLVLEAVLNVWPSQKIGVRISPENQYNSMSDTNPQQHFEYVVAQLNKRNLAYLHTLEGDMLTKTSGVDYTKLKARFSNSYIANNGYDLEKAQAVLNNQQADMIAFGVPFIANPDLVKRYQENLPLNDAMPDTFYMGGETGYTDYPAYSE